MRTPVSVGVVLARPSGVALAETLDRTDGVELVALCDRRARRGGPRVHVTSTAERMPRVSDLLESESLDAIAVSADPDTAFAVAEAAVAADKHVLVDGLIAASVEDAERLSQLAADRRRVVYSLQPSILDAATRELKALLARNRLGEVCYLRAVSNAEGRSHDSVWALVAEECARIVDVLEDEPLEVVAQGASYGRDEVDVATFILRFATGITARVDVSLLDARPARRLAVVGSTATAVVDADRARPLTLHYASPWTDAPARTTGDVHSPAVARTDPVAVGCDGFVHAVRSAAARPPLREAIVLVGVVAALQRSLAEGGAATSPASLRPELRLLDVSASA
jgi:predicted dehydrogenase